MTCVSHLSLLGSVSISHIPPCWVLYLMPVAFWKNRQTCYGATGWYELFRQLDLSVVDDVITAKYYQRQPKYVKSLVLFLFLCWLFEITHTELGRFLTKARQSFWHRVIHLHPRFLPTVSELLGGSGQQVAVEDLQECFERLIEQIFEIVGVIHVTDEDLFLYCQYFTFRGNASGNEALPEQATGGHLFANLIFSLGMGAALTLCQKEESPTDASGGTGETDEAISPGMSGTPRARLLTGFGYSGTQLVCVILGTPGAKNVTQLAKDVRNSGDYFSGLRPSAHVLRQFVSRLDKDKVVAFYERFVSSMRRMKHFGKTVVAIDATIIEVFGDYEDAQWVYDHDQQKYVRGYKLSLIFDVTNKLPVGFVLASSESECTKLLELVDTAKAMIGADKIEFILFDRGYFDTAQFATLDTQEDRFLTPGKQCKTFKEIIGYFEHDLSLYDQVDKTEWRVSFYLCNFIHFTADAVPGADWKWARVTIRRRLVSRQKKDPKTGAMITVTQVQHSIYLTNRLDDRIEDMIKTYGQRVAIENFFEELKNAYFIKGFPSTSRDSVEIWIALTLLAQGLLWLLCSWLTTEDGDHPYCHKELTTLKFDLLERPLSDVLNQTESITPKIARIQHGIEQDIAFIRRFRRFLPRTRPEPPKISVMASISGC